MKSLKISLIDLIKRIIGNLDGNNILRLNIIVRRILKCMYHNFF